MLEVEVVRHPGRGAAADVIALADRSAAADGFRFLSDHLWLDLNSDAGPPLVARAVDGETLRAYAQASRANSGWIIEATVDPDVRTTEPDLLARMLSALLDAVGDDGGGGTVTWWTHDSSDGDSTLAATLGLALDRELLQMSRQLPAPPPAVTTRDYVVGVDEEAVLSVNNRAFADHGEQGGWTLDTLATREREPWFDAAGFRLHERDGRLAAFCWTKLHDPPLDGRRAVGEIYVIAVDPDFQGMGLGKQLTLSGLDSIHRHGMTSAMLYVDGDNETAVAMYARLGFDFTRVDRAYSATLRSRPASRAG